MGAENVLAPTRERVLAAMSELGYSPNPAARALRYGATRTIGIVAHQLGRTGESRTVEAVVKAAGAEGYAVMVVDVDSPTSGVLAETANRLSSQPIDGLVIIRSEEVTPTALSLPPGLPAVISDSQLTGDHPAVGADHAGGSCHAVEHLVALGHRTVHHVAGPADSGSAQLRIEGWRAALKSAGREVPPISWGRWTAESGYEAGHRIARDPEATAVFCANDETAAGVMRALHEAQRMIPDDVSIIGFDDIALAANLWPPLTTVRQDFAEIGHRLVDLLLRQVRGAPVPDGIHEVVPVELIERASTAPPRD